jgi:putative OPT family oligopeptide transporter
MATPAAALTDAVPGALPGAPSAELTARAVAAGLLVGALLCIANLYTGLQAGVWDSGQVTAAVLGFAVATALGRSRLSRLETNATQTIAAAAGAMPAAAGLLGAIPALSLLGREAPAWGIALWAAALGSLGVLFALALRRRLIDEEQLPFPTGIATAEVIEALHAGAQTARGRTRTLLATALAAGVIAWFRQGRPNLIPSELLLPFAISGIPAAALTLGVTTSPLLAGIGVVAGLRVGLSMLFGSLLAWGAIAPLLVKGPLHLQAEYAALSGWLTWPGASVLVGAAVVGLAQQAGAFGGALRDLLALMRRGPGGRVDRARVALLLLALGACALAVAVGRAAFGLHPAHTVLAVLLSALFASVCARSAGLTDLSPVGAAGQLTQASFGALLPGQPALNVAAGSVVSGDAAQTAVVLWSMRAGRALGASPLRMGIGALAGTALGAALCVPAYVLLVRAHGIASARLPMPSSLQWKAVAEVVSRGAAALPAGTLPAVAVAAAAGIALALVEGKRWARWLPAPFAMGIGMLVPVHAAAGLALGGTLMAIATRVRPSAAREMGPVAGAGAIAGESVIGLLVALLVSLGALR